MLNGDDLELSIESCVYRLQELCVVGDDTWIACKYRSGFGQKR